MTAFPPIAEIRTGILPDCDAGPLKRPRGRRTGTNKRSPGLACGYRGARFLTPAASLIFGTYLPVMRDVPDVALCGLCRASAMALGARGRAAFCDLLAVDLTAWRHA
jgi:hypothetical protein